MEQMDDVFKLIGSIFALFVMIMILGFLSKGKLISEWVVMVFFFFVFMLVTGWILITLIIKIKNKDTKDVAKTGLDHYLRKINEILESRPSGEGLVWEGGIYSRYIKKIFFDINRQEHVFVGICAITQDTLKRVVVVYDTKDNDISRFYGDPSPEMMNDPFYGFKPFENLVRAFNPMDAQGYGQQPIHRGYSYRPTYERPVENNNDFYDDTKDIADLERLKKK